MLLHVGYVGEPINYIWCVFPLVELCNFFDFRVDIVENLFNDFSKFTFCGIYEVACRVVGEVIFMVFWGNKSLLFCDLFCAVVDVELLGNRFCLWVNYVGVLRLIKFVKVWSLVRRNEGFCRFQNQEFDKSLHSCGQISNLKTQSATKTST